MYIYLLFIILFVCITFILTFIKNTQNKYIKKSKRKIITDKNGKIINICMVSHGGRIKCLLKKLNIYANDKNKSIKFKNCATVLLKISKKQINVSMFHSGELNHVKPNCKYFVNGAKKELYDTSFNKKEYYDCDDAYHNILYNLNLKQSDIIVDLNIYIVRHSEGYHNTLSLLDKIIYFNDIKDPSITNIGKSQSYNIGEKMKNINFDYYFVSDLKRTKETLNHMFTNIDNNIFVLPCSHELQYFNNGASDGHQHLASLTKENQTAHKCSEHNCNDSLVWDYYHDFYDGVRGDNILMKKCKCRDTNMISMCLFIILSIRNDDCLDISEWIDERIKPCNK
jgi:broad specificity phosphatase PhoE